MNCVSSFWGMESAGEPVSVQWAQLGQARTFFETDLLFFPFILRLILQVSQGTLLKRDFCQAIIY